MEKGQERHIFPGNNTPNGFHSYYHYILPQTDANHIFCLKGGPGVGKSTFMKKIGNRLQTRGFLVEYLHCSSDPDSLDGIVVPSIRVAMVDGTAPHVVDPINPGAVDEIINLGDYWRIDGIKNNKARIIQVNGDVSLLFKRAYKYIKASQVLMDDVTEIFDRSSDQSGIIGESERIIKYIYRDLPLAKLGKIRKQFARAITPNGSVQYLDTLYDASYQIYSIKNHWGVGVNTLLKRVADAATIRGIDVELYYCPMNPTDRIEHVIIPSLKIAVISQSDYYFTAQDGHTTIDL